MRAVGYIRVSTYEQTQGTSLESQKEHIESYAAQKEIELEAIFTDAGVSGGMPLAERPEGSQLVERLNDPKRAQAVIITKIDRGFRSCSDCLYMIESWRKAGIDLHILDMGGLTVDTSTSMGKFLVTMLSGVAELERNLINERCSEGRRVRKAQGFRVGGIPYGYVLDPETNKLIEDPQEQTVIQMILKMKLIENRSFRGIATCLSEAGIPPKQGSQWDHKLVQRILSREVASLSVSEHTSVAA